MIKFKDMPYERANSNLLLKTIEDLTQKFLNAQDAKEQISIYKEYEAVLGEFSSTATIANIRNTVNTKDEFYDKERAFYDEIDPLIEEKTWKFTEAFLNSKFRSELEKEMGELIFINAQMSKDSFSPSIVSLVQEENNLKAEYQKLYASAIVNFDGKEIPLPLLGPYKQNPNRDIRKAAFIAEGSFFEAKKEELEELFDKLVKNRTKQAKTLGYENFLELGYLRRDRNCYTEKDVANFRRQVLSDLVPLIKKIKENQKERIGIKDFKYYDDLFNFTDGNADPVGTPDELLAAGKKMYTEMGEETKEFIELMFDMDLFDVLSKDGKAPGGYCTGISRYKAPFIFSNFNGTAGDVDVLTHEAGHAFAAYLAFRNIEYSALQNPSMDGCEVHSMAMEFLTTPWHHLFFKENTPKYQLSHTEDALNFIPYGTMVDYFQEIIYTNPDLTKEERNEKWLELEKEFRPYIDFDNLPFYSRGAGWQRQLHIYLYPFYYIDYCLAQTVALQIFALFLKDETKAFKTYMDFTIQGGTKTFTDLVKSVGLISPMEDNCLKDICKTVGDWIETLEV